MLSSEVIIVVKGISRQVIVVHSPEQKLFEQAIFILSDSAMGKAGVTNEALMKEANRLLYGSTEDKKRKRIYSGPVWACGGATLTGIVWLLTILF